MKVLYITQYYPPEIGAGGFRAEAIVNGLASLGHELTVITEIPNYPIGKIYTHYKNTLWQEESKDGVKIHRVWVKTSVQMNFIKRLMLYLSYGITAILKGLTLHEKFDIIYTTSPPLFVGLVGYILSRFYRIPFVFEVRDLWPEIAIEMGEIKSKMAIDLSECLERFLYEKASSVVTVTNGFKEKIIQKNIPFDKVKVILNFQKLDNKLDNIRVNKEIKNLYANNFVVIYAGLLGLFQGVDVILNAADILKHEKDIIFLIIGTGVQEMKLKMLAQQKKLQNVIWMPPQPSKLARFLISKAGCSIIPLKNLPSLKVTIPSKLFDYMGYGCPIILSADGEVKQILEMANAGIAVEPENATQLAAAIIKLHKDRKQRDKYRRNGIRAVCKYFSSEKAIQDINKLLKSVLTSIQQTNL